MARQEGRELEFDELIAQGIKDAGIHLEETEPKDLTATQLVSVFLLFVSLGLAFYGGTFIIDWPLESYTVAFLVPACSILLGSVFFISRELRSHELTSDVVILSWLYIPLAFIIPVFIRSSNEFGADQNLGKFQQFAVYSPEIWGGSFAIIALMLTLAFLMEKSRIRAAASKMLKSR